MRAVGLVQRTIQEDIGWGVSEVDDLCEKWSQEACSGATDLEYSDEQTWIIVDPHRV